MAGMLRVPRSRGALSGVLLVLLGLWGGLIPFVGPYFHYAYTPGAAWTYTSGRLWLEILPAAGTVLGGLILLVSGFRPVATFGSWLAVFSGAWFAVGRALAPIWNTGGTVPIGSPIGDTVTRALLDIGCFSGLAVAIVFLGAASLGRLSVIGVRDALLTERREVVPADEVPAEAAGAEPVPADRAAREDTAVTGPGATRGS